MNTLVFTCGDVNGIGPEICLKSFNNLTKDKQHKIIFTCPAEIFENSLSIVQPTFNYKIVKKVNGKIDPDFVTIFDIGKYKQKVGEPTTDSGKAAYKSLKEAFDLVVKKNNASLITAPISKTAFKLAGKNYPGQTELLAKLSGSKKYLMVFLSNDLICGLATIHEPIKNVPRLIKRKTVINSIKILYDTLRYDLGFERPKVAVLGLNPHAGESGNIGKEEISFIYPAIKSMNKYFVNGPFVPDAFFGNQVYKDYNAVLGMYHDQVLIPFKLLNFNTGVNFTAGLPIIRTSPDHGTGYDIAGKGIANNQSMLEAVRWADIIIKNRRKKINES